MKKYDVEGFKEWLIKNELIEIYSKPMSVCKNCKNQTDNYCYIWNHEIKWCGCCKHHELNTIEC